jgi:multidrug efflux system membrane fusion protein
MRLRRILSFVIGVMVIAGVAWYAMTPQQQRERTSGRRGSQTGPVPVLVAAVRKDDVPVYLDGIGTIKALNTVTVRAQVDGQLIKVAFREGQDVTRGYVLAQIDPRTYQATLDQAIAKKAQDEALLANAKLDLERYQRLQATNAGSKQQADTARSLVAQLTAQVQSDQAAIESAQTYLGYTTIVSPIDGRSGLRLVDQGNLVRASDSTGIVVITQIKPIAVTFNLPQQQLARVNKAFAAGPLSVEALAPDGKTVADRGSLQVIDNQVDVTTGTVRLKAEFPNPELQLWPGQFINVRLLVETLKGVNVIPTAAVQRGPQGPFVYVVDADNKVAVRQVTTTQQDDVRTVVASGLEVDEKVITTGFMRLTNDTRVSVQTGEAQAAPVAPPTRERRRRRNGQETPEAGGIGPSAPEATPRPGGSNPRRRSDNPSGAAQ